MTDDLKRHLLAEVYKMRFIKKAAGALALAVLAIACLSACGSKTDAASEEAETMLESAVSFYSLENSSKRLKVELEADIAAGYNWTYKVTDENIINLSGFEFEPADSEDETVPGTWKGTFSPSGKNFGDAKILLYYVQSIEEAESTEPVYILDVNVSADGTITVKSVTE